MLINYEEGMKLKNYILKDDHVSLMATFNMDRPDNRVEYDFWYTSSDDRALDFLRDFKENHLQFGKDVLMTPHFAFWTCKECDKTILKRDCFGNGKYCAINDQNLNTTGSDILLEDLRQYCIHKKVVGKKDEYKFWDYVSYFHEECYNSVTVECSKNAHSSAGLKFKDTQSCVDKTFYGPGQRWEQGNEMFDEE